MGTPMKKRKIQNYRSFRVLRLIFLRGVRWPHNIKKKLFTFFDKHPQTRLSSIGFNWTYNELIVLLEKGNLDHRGGVVV